MSSQASPERQLTLFVARFSPEIAKRARYALTAMRERLPGAVELVYDNAYALVIGFGPNERPSHALFSVAIYPKKVSLCFLQGVHVPDPDGLLQGGGKQVRFLRIENERTLGRRDVRALIRAAVDAAGNPFDASAKRRTIVRAISARQRPRR